MHLLGNFKLIQIRIDFKNLNLQIFFGNNQYPKSITEANNILNNHKFDGSYIKLSNIKITKV